MSQLLQIFALPKRLNILSRWVSSLNKGHHNLNDCQEELVVRYTTSPIKYFLIVIVLNLGRLVWKESKRSSFSNSFPTSLPPFNLFPRRCLAGQGLLTLRTSLGGRVAVENFPSFNSHNYWGSITPGNLLQDSSLVSHSYKIRPSYADNELGCLPTSISLCKGYCGYKSVFEV